MSESVAERCVATAPSPMLSWALFPFRVLPPTAVSLFWTPRQVLLPAEQALPSTAPPLTKVPKHSARRGLIRTGLSLTFQPRFTGADGTLRIAASSSRDLPAVEVAFVPLALHTVSPKLNVALFPSSSLPVQKHLLTTFLIEPSLLHPACPPTEVC